MPKKHKSAFCLLILNINQIVRTMMVDNPVKLLHPKKNQININKKTIKTYVFVSLSVISFSSPVTIATKS